MVKLGRFYIKVLIKTPLFFISLLFAMFIFIVQLSALKNESIVQYTNVICFAMISLNLYFLISTSVGKVILNDTDLLGYSNKKDIIGYLPQKFDIYNNITGYDFLSYVCDIKNINISEKRRK